MSIHQFRRSILTLFCTAWLTSCLTTSAQDRASRADQLSTPERVRKPGWWPTKGTASRDDFVGPLSCAQCHGSVALSQKQHAMARTLMPAAKSEILQEHDGQSFRIGRYNYQIKRTAEGAVNYSVSDGTRTVSGPLLWAFGTGKVGQSYLYEHDEGFYESRFSFFGTVGGFDVTPAHSRADPSSLERAAGRPESSAETRRCFGCHTTASTTNDRFDPTRLIPGITCEACHGPGRNHVAAMKSGPESDTSTILNPGRMKPVDLVDFCGACHTTWWDANLSGAIGVGNTRFQPYRLENSRCWGKGDRRLTCISCHNPHQPLVREAAFYDQACLNCHLATSRDKPDDDHPGAGCPVSTKNCVSCHMPKIEVPEAHFKFTDHQIRIVRAGERFPD